MVDEQGINLERKFEAPGPGTWVLDTTHNAAAMTPYAGQCFAGLPRGFKEGCAKYGLMLDYLQPVLVHGFMFAQQVGFMGKPDSGPPPKFMLQLMSKIHPGLRKRINTAHESFQARRWLQDLKEWDELKLDSIARNTRLQSVDLSSLDKEELIQHLQECFVNAEEMVYRHHIYTVGAIMPMGRFLDVATRSSGLTPVEAIALLQGSSEVSTGIAAAELNKLAMAITDAGITKGDLDALTAEDALNKLREDPAINQALDDYLKITGYMLIGGYCISEKTLNESPNIILARITDALAPKVASETSQALEQSIRERIPEADLEEFDLALADIRQVNRMRDERGVYNDIWGAGVSRTAILEAGRRLVNEGVLSHAELLLEASHEEMLSLLRGEAIVDEAILSERQAWRNYKKIDEVPEFLGTPPQEPPPVELLPEKLQPTMRAFAMVMGNIFEAPAEEEPEKIVGLPVSPGIYEGTAKVIITTKDFDRLEEGDILVTKNTSAGFNVVLPIIGALVTDRGGILSHAAIVSREYGIAGVVGTKTATQLIPDGARIRVNGDTGEVEIL